MPRYTMPPDRDAFFAAAWDVVRSIPRGRVCTYGGVARLVGAPHGMDFTAFAAFGARWVGGAMARCPEDVPWWRVVNARGRISVRDGSASQRERLEAEGVVFDRRGRIDLGAAGWAPEGEPPGPPRREAGGCAPAPSHDHGPV